ncbi:MAG: VTT domain-containing protein [Lactobacillales bacterium]|jgi:membrane-associated protein|nr:VTT domain-containing protein [Lactobacillales bacterium]
MSELITNILTTFTGGHSWIIYVLIFLVIFIETGVVILPFLPGDSVLFLVGGLAAVPANNLNVFVLFFSLSIAAIIGDFLNFEIGKRFGDTIPKHPKLQKVLTPARMEDAHNFFEKWGNFAIFIKRFAPFIRTFVPFIAGSSQMTFRKFAWFNVLGGVCWVAIGVFAGFFFGNIPAVQEHFELIMIGIIIVSLLPVGIVALKNKFNKKDAA